MSEVNWGGALLQAAQSQAARLTEAEAEIKRLKVTVRTLQRRLYEARERQANWELRRQAWAADRRELLRQLDGAKLTARHPW